MLDRLVGLETEYATLIQSPADQAQPPSRREIYAALCLQISRRLPTARGRYDSDTLFLANGGAFSLESSPARLHLPGGLIEGATAEVRSPSQVVQCQRAQDRLIAESAAQCGIPGRVRIIKNSCDANGHVYGCQENYSAPVAEGIWLWGYWGLMGLVLPLAMVYWMVCLSVLAAELAAVIISRPLIQGWKKIRSRNRSPNETPTDNAAESTEADLEDDQEESAGQEESWSIPLPGWLLTATAMMLRIVSLPAAAMLYLTIRTTAFRRQRKYLTTFLVSRVVLTGAGHVDRGNRFRLSSKAMAIDSVAGFGGYWGERPIFVFHHWLQQLCGRSLLSRRSLVEMFYRRQRLQIGLSDSNVSDTAEFLKVGTTSLVLDMIESGGGEDLPRLKRPVPALHRITADWDLVARVPTTRGELSGLEIQRAYWRACHRYVAQQDVADDHEAWTVLRRWEEVLDALTLFRSTLIDPRPALGHIDWLTKKWMLDRLDDSIVPPEPLSSAEEPSTADPAVATTASTPPTSPTSPAIGRAAKSAAKRWAARKKVDIRYHELSPDSYFSRLLEVAPEAAAADAAAIELALRMPPPGTPAVRRAQLIREFSGGPEPLTVDWSHVVIGSGRSRRVVSVQHSR